MDYNIVIFIKQKTPKREFGCFLHLKQVQIILSTNYLAKATARVSRITVIFI